MFRFLTKFKVTVTVIKTLVLKLQGKVETVMQKDSNIQKGAISKLEIQTMKICIDSGDYYVLILATTMY